MSAPRNVLEGGERMLAKMVEERDKNKLDLFLQEMDNLDKFLDDAETLLRSGHDQSSSGMDELLQISDGDLLPIKDIPVMIEGGTSAMQIKKESVNGLEEKPKKIKREAPQEDDTVHQNVVPQMITRSSVTKNIKTDAKPIVNNDDSAFDWLKTIPLQQNQKPSKPSTTLNDCLDSFEVTLQIVKFDENLTNSIPFSRPIFLLDVWASMQT